MPVQPLVARGEAISDQRSASWAPNNCGIDVGVARAVREFGCSGKKDKSATSLFWRGPG